MLLLLGTKHGEISLIVVTPFGGLALYISRRLIMRTIIFIAIMVACVAIVGYIEDPCATEGLMSGCAN
jgi:hypothetical protein